MNLRQRNLTVNKFIVESDLGIENPKNIIESNREDRARLLLKTTTRHFEGRFETGVLWKKDDVHMLDSLKMAKNRLQCSLREINSDKNYETFYKAEIQKLMGKNWARNHRIMKKTKEAQLHGIYRFWDD